MVIHRDEKNLPYGSLALFDVSPPEAHSFAYNVGQVLCNQLKNVEVRKFADGETDIDIPRSVRGKDVYVFQSYIPPLGERLYELENFLDAVTMGGSARRVTVVLPYLFGSRGERRTKPRQSVPTLVVAKNLHNHGASRVVTVCVHTTAIGSIYNAVGLGFENLEFEHLAVNYILNHAGEQPIVIGSPDVGGAPRVRAVRKILMGSVPEYVRGGLEAALAFADKYRPAPNVAEVNEITGNVEGKSVYIVDDIGDTVGTLAAAAKAYRVKGAREVRALLCHPVLSSGKEGKKGAEENLKDMLDNGIVDEVIFGNTIPLKPFTAQYTHVRVIPIEPFVAEAIMRLNADESVSGIHDYSQIVRAYQNGARIVYGSNPQLIEIKKKKLSGTRRREHPRSHSSPEAVTS